LLDSRLGHSTATPTPNQSKSSQGQGHPFSRSYGVILPSSLARVLSRALAFSACLPVSVCGTGSRRFTRGFSRLLFAPLQLRFLGLVRTLKVYVDGFTCPPSTVPNAHFQPCDGNPKQRHPFVSLSSPTGDGISTVCPSATPFGLALGPAKPGRTNLPQETLDFRPERFSLSFSLLIPAFSLLHRPGLLTVSLLSVQDAPLPPQVNLRSAASVAGLSPVEFSAQRHSTSPMLLVV
jgi:hypothetical protein